MNDRGQYGPPRIGQLAPRTTTVYVERESSSIARILGGILVVGGALWSRHQSKQIEQLYKTAGLPYQSFTGSIRQGAGSTLRSLVDRVRSKREMRPATSPVPVAEATVVRTSSTNGGND